VAELVHGKINVLEASPQPLSAVLREKGLPPNAQRLVKAEMLTCRKGKNVTSGKAAEKERTFSSFFGFTPWKEIFL
jgi:hypothetical protein